MTPDERDFLKRAFQATVDEPLEAGDPRYVDLTAVRGHDDPVALMARTIELSAGESVQLFSGFPGTGKTTELKRLPRGLTGSEYAFVFVDAERYQSAFAPIAVPQILIAIVDKARELLERAAPAPAFWGELATVTLHRSGGESEDVAACIKKDPSVWQTLPSLSFGDIGSLVHQVRTFFADWVEKLGELRGRATKAVLVVDSIDHLQGSARNDFVVLASVEALFADHADALAIPDVHVVYTVPPYVTPSFARGRILRESGSVRMLPAATVRDPEGAGHRAGVEALKGLIARRIDCTRLYRDDSKLEELIQCSGGNVRDLLRLIHESVRRTATLPVSRDAVDAVVEQARADLHPVAKQDVVALAQIAQTHSLGSETPTAPHDLARLANAHLLQLYRNGRYWYDVHPLIRDTVLQQAPSMAVIAREPDPAPASPKPPRTAAPQAAPVVLTPDMRVSLVVQSYRALRRVRWMLPRGVSALVGPNGSGKTTLLDVPDLLRHALTHDVRKAIDDRGGPGSLRSARADLNAPIILGVELDQLGWQLDLSPKGPAFNLLYGERATLSGAVVLVSADDPRPLLRRFAEEPNGAAFRPLVALLEGYRLYGTYDIASIRVNGSQASSDEHLHPDGRNIFSVLRNWRDRKETRPRWDFVLASLKESFPDTFDDLDFDMAGQTVAGSIVAPQPDVRIPTYFAANGWLVALLHLAAVASTGPAGVVAIDEMENGLHPYAIRALIDAMRRWAELTGISIVLATHSPVVLDQFKDTPDHVFVMEPGREPAPTRLDELHNPEWLAHFSLGDLYAHDEFGAQHKDADRVA